LTGPISDIFPLTKAQAGLLLGSLTESEPGLYVVQMRYALTGRLNQDRLEAAWQALASRHDVLRTAVAWEATAYPVNVVMTAVDIPVTWLDLRTCDDKSPPSAVQDFLIADRMRAFDLTQAPLSRVTVLRTGETDWQMVWTHHHVILDGWSTARLTAELWQLYTGGLPWASPIGFSAYAASLADDALGHRTQDEAHWRERISGGDALVALDRPRTAAAGVWTDHNLPVTEGRLATWLEAAREHGVTLATLHHAAWAMTLRGAGLGPDHLVLGTVADTRGAEGGEVIGLCVASVPLRVSFGSCSVGKWLHDIAVERAAGQDHARANLAEHRTWNKDASEVPFRYLLAVETYPHDGLTDPQAGEDLAVRYLGVHESTEYALTAGVPVGSPRLKLTIDTRRISSADATMLLKQWATCLDQFAIVRSEAPLQDLLGAIPEREIGPTLPERIGDLARQHPERPAFRDATTCITLAGLDRAAHRLAHRLRLEGLQANDRVGVLVDDSAVVAVAVLGTLLAGGVVVPLDPRHPAPYREAVLSAAHVRQVLTSRPDARPDWSLTTPLVVSEILADDNTLDVTGFVRSDQAGTAFLVFDTGSALRPSAHAHDQESLLETAAAAWALLDLHDGDEWVVTRPATGPGVPWEMWAAPLHIGCTLIAPGAQHASDELARLTSRPAAAVVGVLRSEAPDLAELMGDRARVVSVSRDDGVITLWSAAGDRLGNIGSVSGRRGMRYLTTDVGDAAAADIEDVLLRIPDVITCEVRQQPDGSLVAVVGMSSADRPTRDLTRALRSALPEDWVPQVMTSDPAGGNRTGEQRLVEAQVTDLWAQILGLPSVPPDIPFFDLGGHSLLLFAVLRGLRRQGWTSLELTDLLAHPTVRSLSRWLSRPEASEATPPPADGGPRHTASAARRERGRP
jgi:hypothetical protein